MFYPFTEDDLIAGFRLLLSEDEARAVVRAMGSAGGAVHSVHTGPFPAQEADPRLEFATVSHVTLTQDTLVLMSLASTALTDKVDAFRKAHGPVPPAAEHRWQQRVGELKRALMQSSPRCQ